MIGLLKLEFWLAVALHAARVRRGVEERLTRVHTYAMRKAFPEGRR